MSNSIPDQGPLGDTAQEAPLALFEFDSHQIRAITDEQGDPWFVAKDVAETLGYKDTDSAVRTHCRKAKSLKDIDPAKYRGYINQVLRLDSKTKLIPESDLYRLTTSSTLESAERFQDWIFEEVLPSIRKTGAYALKRSSDENVLKTLNLSFKILGILEGHPVVHQHKAIGQVLEQTGVDFRILLPDLVAARKQYLGIRGFSEAQKNAIFELSKTAPPAPLEKWSLVSFRDAVLEQKIVPSISGIMLRRILLGFSHRADYNHNIIRTCTVSDAVH